MRRPRFYIFSIFLCLLHTLDAQQGVVTIFYGADDDSRQFFHAQVCRNPQQFGGGGVQLELVPYGAARQLYNRELKKYDFSCPNGCDRLKAHACVLRENEGRDVQPETLRKICDLFSATDAAPPSCEDNFFANFGTRTETVAPRIAKFPAVMFNNKYDPAASERQVAKLDVGGLPGRASSLLGNAWCFCVSLWIVFGAL